MSLAHQLTVDINDQLTVAQVLCKHQPMVETQEIRDAFAARLNRALDGMPEIRQERGRNVDLHGALEKLGARAKKQATHKWLTGASIPERDNMELLARWLGVRVEWLEYGLGEMRESDQAKPEPEPSADSSDDEYIHVPLKSARGAMGRGYENPYVEVKGHLAFKRSWIKARGLNAKYLEAFYADGDSMYPTINSGDVVLLNKAQKEPVHNKIFALNGADGVIIKRLSYASAVNQWGLISDNLDKREFPDQWLDEDDEPMSLMGQIVWRGGDL
ncbi:LexA family transcriptional regulator [Pseudomonas sp. GD04087]|uniref:S24 family peptidase n=1 Tax=unclassified Pseudomonas TaxID=196821 RepID=UPI002447AA77|nr:MULTISPECIES: S24 family peptidase [unclassified Pseudomonas]MDH0293379.1 LexA family transcriptional regulator [Pseudomonas sp. GD04087]MDH1053026.1 LexA family transcriptional regulator [Pseudomonas sp. GD03903]MDH2003588.1 LexA family transcriptional regulator [Pseudomonas sp. GD03691]